MVDKCALFSNAIPSNVLRVLFCLQMLTVEKCDSLEHVFDLEGLNADECKKGHMGDLEELQLNDLPRLTGLWNKDPGGILWFENLKLLKVHDCGKLTSIFTLSMAFGLVELQQLEVKTCNSMEHIITKEDDEEWDATIFSQLNSMSLEHLPSLLSFYSGSNVLECPLLRKIEVVDCPKAELFASTFSNEQYSEEMVDQSDGRFCNKDLKIFAGKVEIPSLEELKIEWNIFKYILNRKLEVEFLESLKGIELTCFPGQSALLPSDILQRMPSLEKLVLSDALSEETILQLVNTGDEKKHAISVDSQQLLVYQNLKALEVCFQNLTILKVSKCHCLTSIMPASAARTLGQLRTMIIKECKMVKEIVASEADGVENEILFGQLQHLELHDLPCLKRFCLGDYTFNLPSLQEVIVRECSSMEIFAREALTTNKLWRVQTGKHNYEWEWEGSLNSTIQALFIP